MSDPEQILYKNNGKATIDRNFFKSMAKMIKANRPSKADADVVDEKACTKGLRNSNVRVEEEEDDDIVASLEKNTPKQNLSGMRRTHSDQIFASFSESNTSVGSTSTLASSKSHTDFSKVASDMSDQEQILYKNNGKATIDRNFFKSMAKMIKANRSSKADADVVDEKACTHYSDYTVCYTSNSSCGKKSGYVDWIEGHAMRVRIDLKFHLLHERMLACEASNDQNRR
jgi:hypothetical protein